MVLLGACAEYWSHHALYAQRSLVCYMNFKWKLQGVMQEKNKLYPGKSRFTGNINPSNVLAPTIWQLRVFKVTFPLASNFVDVDGEA